MNYFLDRKIVVATMHGKEQVILPICENRLQLKGIISHSLNTDQFGTFSGEIPRRLTPHDAALSKIKAAIEETGADVGIASEGSFGAHPTIPFINANVEYVLYYDPKFEILKGANFITTEICAYNENIVANFNLKSFLSKNQFPSHACILSGIDPISQKRIYVKGIQSYDEVDTTISLFEKQSFYDFQVESDLRAFMNPTRMNAIKKATEKLCDVLLNKCPSCEFPGYDANEFIKGLPCELCYTPTNLIKSIKYYCDKCKWNEIVKADGPDFADPQYCDNCNP